MPREQPHRRCRTVAEFEAGDRADRLVADRHERLSVHRSRAPSAPGHSIAAHRRHVRPDRGCAARRPERSSANTSTASSTPSSLPTHERLRLDCHRRDNRTCLRPRRPSGSNATNEPVRRSSPSVIVPGAIDRRRGRELDPDRSVVGAGFGHEIRRHDTDRTDVARLDRGEHRVRTRTTPAGPSRTRTVRTGRPSRRASPVSSASVPAIDTSIRTDAGTSADSGTVAGGAASTTVVGSGGYRLRQSMSRLVAGPSPSRTPSMPSDDQHDGDDGAQRLHAKAPSGRDREDIDRPASGGDVSPERGEVAEVRVVREHLDRRIARADASRAAGCASACAGCTRRA